MTKSTEQAPSFNLWNEPWIALERDGTVTQHSIRDALLNANVYVAIYDASPLVVVGIHRLLTAILQDALNPQENSDLEQLWEDGKFPIDKIEQFGKQYADRFDLFSEDKPFLQSYDLPLFPNPKTERSKSAAQLFPETPAGSLITHYCHITEDELVFSPAAVAAGIVTIPPFVSSGGAGLMPSINGVPPIYVLPGGNTLFESLAASLVSATMLYKYPAIKDDQPWWKRPAPVIVQESKKGGQKEYRQLSEVGYLHGLTFPARKVRLHPERLNATCSRSGQFSEWCVRTMVSRMGESLVEDAAFWRDPFVAYRPSKPKTASGKRKSTQIKRVGSKPNPIRPSRNRVVWREFTGLFLQRKDAEQLIRRPLFLDQLNELAIGRQTQSYPFRCVAFQTDGKMKYYEWMDFGFDVPPSLLQDPDGAKWTDDALAFTINCAKTITSVFSAKFGHKTKNAERFKRLKESLEEDYWSTLAVEFRQYVLDLGDHEKQQQTLERWFDKAVREAQNEFDRAADATGDDGRTLGEIVQGKEQCRKQLDKEIRRIYAGTQT